jgi:ATP-dependent DNA helicase RecG
MKLYNDVKKSLPYELSTGQEKVISSILEDMKNGKNVRALLSSDVGSGKTTVALLLSCVMAGRTNNFNGYQVAWLVPSKTLAMQHTEELKSYLDPLGYEVLYLSATMKKKEREEALRKIENGEVNFIVGTHSILNDEVKFKDLALIVCDESHRFGVIARNKLSQKVSGCAHLLTMSGTPIPRTLALTVTKNGQKLYTMERPSGRLPIKTCISNNRNAVFKFIRKEVSADHQVYVVCPMINKNDDEKMEGVMSVEEISDLYIEELSPDGITVATLTGKNKATETEEIIENFKNNKTNVLIATSVIEVGINIPNATTMVIENAERFGIASLHQLRGRVGRKAGSQGYCVLRSEDAENDRLNALVKEQDGFKLSEIDLALRKSGDLLGEMQSGENKYVELMLDNKTLFEHISEKIIPTLIDEGTIDDFIDYRYNKDNN